MAIVNGYVTEPEVRHWTGADPDVNDELHDLIEAAVNAVSRYIDGLCKRHFYQVAEPRWFEADDAYNLSLGHYNDLTETTPVVLKTDEDGDGIYEAVWADNEFQLRPVNPRAAAEVGPYRSVRGINRRFPINAREGGLMERVEITATWGWPGAIPYSIRQATKIQVARIIKRKEAPEGVLGLGQFGVVRVGHRVDPDVWQLISRYRLRSLG